MSAGHSDGRARVKLPSSQSGAFVILEMWPELGGAISKERCHLFQITLANVEVQQQGWRVEFV